MIFYLIIFSQSYPSFNYCSNKRFIDNLQFLEFVIENCFFENFINNENGGVIFIQSGVNINENSTIYILFTIFSTCYALNAGAIYLYNIPCQEITGSCFYNCSSNIKYDTILCDVFSIGYFNGLSFSKCDLNKNNQWLNGFQGNIANLYNFNNSNHLKNLNSGIYISSINVLELYNCNFGFNKGKSIIYIMDNNIVDIENINIFRNEINNGVSWIMKSIDILNVNYCNLIKNNGTLFTINSININSFSNISINHNDNIFSSDSKTFSYQLISNQEIKKNYFYETFLCYQEFSYNPTIQIFNLKIASQFEKN